MIDRDVSAIMRGLAPVLREQVEAISARVIREAETAEAIRSAEHRAFMAEQREALAMLTRQGEDAVRRMEARLATVKDGKDGVDGLPGRDGVDGAEGPIGPAGADGRDGLDGKDGIAGTNGRDGVDGSDGAEGPQGPKGEPGADGADGAPGERGPVGETGQPGETGPAGERGDQGEPGQDGLKGEPGADGTDGTPGTNGSDGIDGRDAYPGEARGLFDPSATYRALDVVSLNGCEWRAKRDAPGELPGDGWMLSAAKGKRGPNGDKGLPGANLIAAYVERDSLELVLTRDDGIEVKADLSGLGRLIARGTDDV